MDGRTDRQNYDSQERASIAASRSKNDNTPESWTDRQTDGQPPRYAYASRGKNALLFTRVILERQGLRAVSLN